MNKNTLPKIQASITTANIKLGLDPADIFQLMQGSNLMKTRA